MVASVGCILGFQGNRTWVRSLTLPLTSCVASDRAFSLSGMHPHIWGDTLSPTSSSDRNNELVLVEMTMQQAFRDLD